MFDLTGFPQHLLALLVSPARGILLYAPILFALPMSGISPWANDYLFKRLSGICLVAVAANLMFFGLSGTWDGGFGRGPRYLVAPLVFLVPLFARVSWNRRSVRILLIISILVQCGSVVLPTTTEDFLATLRREAGQTCDVWTLGCSGIWLRPGLAVRALGTTVSNRRLPTLEEGAPASAADALPTSDFQAVYWWPVRFAYRLHRGTPVLGFLVSLFCLMAGLSVSSWSAV